MKSRPSAFRRLIVKFYSLIENPATNGHFCCINMVHLSFGNEFYKNASKKNFLVRIFWNILSKNILLFVNSWFKRFWNHPFKDALSQNNSLFNNDKAHWNNQLWLIFVIPTTLSAIYKIFYQSVTQKPNYLLLWGIIFLISKLMLDEICLTLTNLQKLLNWK